MRTTLWKVKANNNFGKIVKGMEVEIIIKGRSNQPTTKEVILALKNKYGIEGFTSIPSGLLEYIKQ